jgi:hypothetical protein
LSRDFAPASFPDIDGSLLHSVGGGDTRDLAAYRLNRRVIAVGAQNALRDLGWFRQFRFSSTMPMRAANAERGGLLCPSRLWPPLQPGSFQ